MKIFSMDKMLHHFFVKHPEENGMNYLQHLLHSWSISLQMLKGSVSLLIHGLIPGVFQKTGSRTIRSLYGKLFPQM